MLLISLVYIGVALVTGYIIVISISGRGILHIAVRGGCTPIRTTYRERNIVSQAAVENADASFVYYKLWALVRTDHVISFNTFTFSDNATTHYSVPTLYKHKYADLARNVVISSAYFVPNRSCSSHQSLSLGARGEGLQKGFQFQELVTIVCPKYRILNL